MRVTSPSVALPGALALVLASTPAAAIAHARGISTSHRPARTERQEFASLRVANRAGEAGDSERFFNNAESTGAVPEGAATPEALAMPVVPAPKPPPTRAEMQAFEKLREDIDRAAENEDWDTFLDRSAKALDALPEHESSRADRREVAGLVGKYHLEIRSELQLRRSVEVLRAYKAQLDAAYGGEASSMPEGVSAEEAIDDLLGRLPETHDSVTPPPPPPATMRAEPVDADAVSAHPRRRAFLISGGVLTGVGSVLLVAGLAFYGNAFVRYNKLRDRYDDDPSSVSMDAEKRAWNRMPASLGLIVPGILLVGTGIGLLVVGLRRPRHDEQRRISFGVGQLGVRF